jgi:NADH-quinone oxidoreductase subunit I
MTFPSLLRRAWSNLFKKPATVQYPFKKLTPPVTYRGRHVLVNERCTSCGLCAKICPAFAITMVPAEGKALRIIDLSKCIFCYQCESVCPRGAIKRGKDYELATWRKEDLVLR